ncbi:TPA: tail fiber assembly protein [Aeromonas dhakensis]|nr:tail fiber assembly protein [Aeromonas dhakensis]
MESTIVFSAVTAWFYDTVIFDENDIPKPFVSISHERHAELIKGAEQGLEIKADEAGIPILVKPEISIEDALAAAKNEISTRLIEANGIIAPLVYLESIGQLSDSEKHALDKWRQYTIAVSRIYLQSGYPRSIELPVRPT